ncbi:GNAT family N-acetyltransferase [Pontibacter sp. JAM-7]|uniref:GNAT family N-acetyltransferase n=1 Tax=Pontibacter sp. JAM-7 TaxID=3366581 RepID=UPI003AF6476D
MHIQRAAKQDATDLAQLLNLAGERMPAYLWRAMAAPGQNPMEVGAMRAAREEGGFSYRNARVCVSQASVQGMIVSYPQPDAFTTEGLDNYPDIVRPLVRLEAEAPGSWYINAVATFEQYRGLGIAQMLMREAETKAGSVGVSEMSLIVASENRRAKDLYEHLGYVEIAALPVVLYPGCMHGGDWLLMTKQLTRG